MSNPLNQLSNALERFILSRAKPNNLFAEYYNRTRSRAEYKRQATAYNAKEIKDWKSAIMAATDPDNPRRGDLMRFYQSLRLDNHLSSVIDTRVLRVQRSSFKIVNEKGEENDALRELLERPWFEELVRFVVSKTFNGTTLIEMFDINDNGELIRITEIPQSNFIATKGLIIKNEWDNNGVSYRTGAYSDYYLQIGNDYELGMLNELAMIILAKKLGLGSWMSYIEKFGIPPIFVVTDRMDDTRLGELYTMLKEFRSDHFGILQGNEKVEIPNNNNMDGYQSFKALNEFADNQISKRVLGSTASTDEKSFTGAALVQERVAQDRYEADKLLFKYYFNTYIRQRLAKLSSVYGEFAVHTLIWDNQETLSIDKYIDGIQKLSSFYEFDIDEVKTRTGLPIIGTKQNSLPANEPTPDPQKKKINAALNSPHALQYPPVSKGMYFRLQAATWDAAIERLANQIYNGETKPVDLDRDLVLKNYAALNNSAKQGYGSKYYDDEITRGIRENLMRFSGAKSYNLMQELELLRKQSGSKEDFIEDAKKLVNRHNEDYLNTEKKYAANSLSSMKNYMEYEKDSDIYPNLKNRTMLDSNVRDSHAINEGVIKPISEWTEIPPYDPGCRCWLEQTTEEPTSKGLKNINPQWANNPAVTGKVFTELHSYNLNVREPDIRRMRENTELMKEFIPYSRTIKTESGHTVFVNDFADTVDLDENISAAKKIAESLNRNVYIRHHFDGGIAQKQKNPELGIGTKNNLADLKTYKGESQIYSFTQNALKSANRQKAQYLVIDVSTINKKEMEFVNRALKGGVNNRNSNIQKVIVIRGDKVTGITRKQLQKGDFTALDQ